MKLMALSKKEAQDILTNKIYMLVVVVQVFIILGAFGLGVASSIVTDPDLLDKYGATSSLKVGISEDLKNSTIVNDLKEQNLNLIFFKDINDADKLLGSQLVAVIRVSPEGDVLLQSDTSNVFYPVVLEKISTATDKYKLEKKLKAGGLSTDLIQKIENPIVLSQINVKNGNYSDLAMDTPYFVEIMYGFILPFVLLLPFFLASNIVTDSVVGERERKTFEMLLMAPFSSSMVILGKILPIFSFSIIQSILWLILLDLLGLPIYNAFSLIGIMIFVGLAFIGIGILISMFVDSTKEANSAITLVLMFTSFILFIPLFMKISYFESIINFIPTVLMVKMASTPSFEFSWLIYMLPTVLISTLIFGLTVMYFKHERAIRL